MVDWLPEHDEYLRKAWGKDDVDVIAREVGHPIPSTLNRASILGLRGHGCMVDPVRDQKYMDKIRRELYG